MKNKLERRMYALSKSQSTFYNEQIGILKIKPID